MIMNEKQKKAMELLGNLYFKQERLTSDEYNLLMEFVVKEREVVYYPYYQSPHYPIRTSDWGEITCSENSLKE